MLCTPRHCLHIATRSFSKARVVSCPSTIACCNARERKSGNQLHKGRYGEWLALHQVLAGNSTTIYLYMLGTTTTLSMLFQVLGLWLLVHLKEYLDFKLGLDVTEININFEINIKKV